MDDLLRQSFIGWGKFIFCTALMLFLPAGFRFGAGWMWLAIVGICVALITLYLSKYDRALLARRVKAGVRAETDPAQQIILLCAAVAFALPVLLPAFDHRWGWSSVPAALIGAGDILTGAGIFIVFLTFRANSFASATVTVAEDHQIISTGPYAYVRHPMYAGVLLAMAATPLALGSWWGLLSVAPVAAVLVWRLRAEEKYLRQNLPGYAAYCGKVTARLIPALF